MQGIQSEDTFLSTGAGFCRLPVFQQLTYIMAAMREKN